eukprot:s4134_g1.t1
MRMCAACKQAIGNAKEFAAATTAAVIDLPCGHSALHRCGAVRADVCVQSWRPWGQALIRAMSKTTHEGKGRACIAYLCPILSIFPTLLPRCELCSWLAFSALATLPTATQFGGTFSAAAAFRVARFPCGRSKFGFWFRNATFEARLLHFTREAHTEKTTLTLAMFDWKILFRMPQLAHVALPRRADVCIVLCAFATDAILVLALPLTGRECCCRLAFCTGCAPTFFAIFGQQRVPVDRIPSKMPQKKVSAQTNSFLERSRVKRSKNQQL